MFAIKFIHLFLEEEKNETIDIPEMLYLPQPWIWSAWSQEKEKESRKT